MGLWLLGSRTGFERSRVFLFCFVWGRDGLGLTVLMRRRGSKGDESREMYKYVKEVS